MGRGPCSARRPLPVSYTHLDVYKRQGQTHGSVRRDVEPAAAAALLIAMVEGYGSLAKNAQDPKVMKAGIRSIVDWVRSLRPPGNRKRG